MPEVPNLKIDSHQHFWKYDPIGYSWINEPLQLLKKDFLPKDLKPLLKAHNFDGCIAVQAAQNEEETKFLLELAAEHRFIKGVVGWLDISSADFYDKLKFYSQNPFFKGIRHVVYDQQGEFFLDPAFQKGISQLQDFGLSFDLLAFDYQLPGAIKLVKKFPDQAFVLDHMGKPQISKALSQEWKNNIKELASFSNVYCKVSGLVTETTNFEWEMKDFYPYLDVVYNAFGEERLMFGSDWPVCLVAGSYTNTVEIVEKYTSNSSFSVENIIGRNAAKFYNI